MNFVGLNTKFNLTQIEIKWNILSIGKLGGNSGAGGDNLNRQIDRQTEAIIYVGQRISNAWSACMCDCVCDSSCVTLHVWLCECDSTCVLHGAYFLLIHSNPFECIETRLLQWIFYSQGFGALAPLSTSKGWFETFYFFYFESSCKFTGWSKMKNWYFST